MVFLFIAFLFTVFIFVLPVNISATGYFDNDTKQMRLSMRLSFIEKLLGKVRKKKKTGEDLSPGKKLALPIKGLLQNFPVEVIKEIRLSINLPKSIPDAFVVISALTVLNSFLPIKITPHFGDRFYMEAEAKINFNLFLIIPVIKQTLKRKGELIWK